MKAYYAWFGKDTTIYEAVLTSSVFISIMKHA